MRKYSLSLDALLQKKLAMLLSVYKLKSLEAYVIRSIEADWLRDA